MRLKPGDKVICINDNGVSRLNFGNIYIVYKVHPHNRFITVEEDPDCETFGWMCKRFIKINDIPNYKFVAFRLTGNIKYLE